MLYREWIFTLRHWHTYAVSLLVLAAVAIVASDPSTRETTVRYSVFLMPVMLGLGAERAFTDVAHGFGAVLLRYPQSALKLVSAKVAADAPVGTALAMISAGPVLADIGPTGWVAIAATATCIATLLVVAAASVPTQWMQISVWLLAIPFAIIASPAAGPGFIAVAHLLPPTGCAQLAAEVGAGTVQHPTLILAVALETGAMIVLASKRYRRAVLQAL